MSARRLWREVYRLARMTPCKEGQNLTWFRAYPRNMGMDAIQSAWTGKHGDALKNGNPSFRRMCMRNGCSREYLLFGTSFPNIRLPR